MDSLQKIGSSIPGPQCRLFSAAATRRGFVPRQIPVRRKWGEKNWQFRFKFDQPLRLCRVSKQDLWNSRKKSDASAGWRKIIVIICFSIIYIFSFQWKVKFHHWQPWCCSFSPSPKPVLGPEIPRQISILKITRKEGTRKDRARSRDPLGLKIITF